MVRDITLHSDVEDRSSNHGWEHTIRTSPSSVPRFSTPCRDMGATKVNRRGDLGSDSDASSPDPTPRAVSILLSPEKRPLQDSPTRRLPLRSVGSSPDLIAVRSGQKLPRLSRRDSKRCEARVPLRPYSWEILEDLSSWTEPIGRPAACGATRSGKTLRETEYTEEVNSRPVKGGEGSSRGNPSNSYDDHDSDGVSVDGALGTPPPSIKPADMSERDVEAWQREIQRNYQELLEHKDDTIMMRAEAWSDAE